MRERTRMIVGAVILGLGLILLIDALVGVNIWDYLWPLIIIGIGVWILMRSRKMERRGLTVFQLLGDVRRRGAWTVREEEIWCVIGDVRLDLTEAQIPEGETTIALRGFVGSVNITVPADIGLAVTSSAILTDARVLGDKQDYVLTVYEAKSDNYVEAARKVRLDILYFVVDLRARMAVEQPVG
ncbi:MAG: cell wall-active antibiotics response protein LiaF [Anaerolineae bacterium]